MGKHRWVDNFGDYSSYNCRYGSEFGGNTLIYHYGKARTRIYGGFCGFDSGRSRKYPGIADTPDADYRVINLICMPFSRHLKIALLFMDETGKIGYAKKQEFFNIVPDRTLHGNKDHAVSAKDKPDGVK